MAQLEQTGDAKQRVELLKLINQIVKKPCTSTCTKECAKGGDADGNKS